MIGRLACLLGVHDVDVLAHRLGFVRIALCRRPGCARYAVRRGWAR